MNDVTICIPVYNNLEITKLCFEQLFFTKNENRGFNLIVCNDASTDPKVSEYLKQIDCKLIEHSQNQGFIKSVNDMLKEVETKYLVLMNNDVFVYENWLDKLLEPLDKNEVCGISSLYGRLDEQGNVNSATFECVAIRKKVIEKIPNLDTTYGLGYYDDEDFCLQAKLAGWKIDYPQLDESLIEHLGGQTFGKSKGELLKKNVKIFIKKWYGLSKNLSIVKNHFKYLFNPFKGKPGFSEEEIKQIVESKD